MSNIFEGTYLMEQFHKQIYEYYGVRKFVPKSQIPKFKTLERLLTDSDIDVTHYAESVCKLLKPWCEGKGLLFIPAHVFAGDFAFNKYMKLRNTVSVELVDVEGIEIDMSLAVATELQLFTFYLSSLRAGKFVRVLELVNMFLNSSNRNITSEWKKLVVADKRSIIEARAIDILVANGRYLHTRRVVTDYPGLVVVYLKNIRKRTKKLGGLKRNRVAWGNIPLVKRNQYAAELTTLTDELKSFVEVDRYE